MPEAADLIEKQPVEELPSPSPTLYPPSDVSVPHPSRAYRSDQHLNLLTHPAVLKRLPALGPAFQAESMRDRLQAALFGDTNPTSWIESCTPGKAYYESDGLCLLQYKLTVTQANQKSSLVVNAHIFEDPKSSTVYYQEKVAPLVSATRGRPEFSTMTEPAAVFDDLAMVVSVFPIDGQIPTLIAATDLEYMAPYIHSIYPNPAQEPFMIQAIRIELAHYGRFKRCVLRYWLDGQKDETGKQQTRLVYGKVDAVNSPEQMFAVTDALLIWGQSERNQHLFRVPTLYGYNPDLKIVLMEAIPGEALFSRLLKARVRGEGTLQLEEFLLEDAIINASRVAASLHASEIPLGQERTITDEILLLREQVNGIQEVLPEVGDRLASWLDEIGVVGMRQSALPLRFSHGDFTYTQFIYDQGQTGLVDFDNVCQAEPALDVGQYLAYLRFNIRKEELPDQPFPPEAIEQLCSVFLSTYLEYSQRWLEDETAFRARVEVYELLSLIRLGIHSWQKLKGSRLNHAMSLLEERVTCLTQAN